MNSFSTTTATAFFLILALHGPTHVTAAFGEDITDDRNTDSKFRLKWSQNNVMPKPRSDLTATLSSESGKAMVYLVGGCASANEKAPWDSSMYYCPSTTDECAVFDPAQKSFSTCANTPTHRYRHAAVEVEGKVWLLGGRDVEDNMVKSIDVYTPSSDTWATVATWEEATSDLAAFAVGNDIFVLGGYLAGYNATAGMSKIDAKQTIATKKLVITTAASMTHARGDVFATVMGDYAYVTGGFSHHDWCNPLDSVERYDIPAGTWTVTESIGLGRADKALVALDGWVFAIGGERKDAQCSSIPVPVAHVEIFDIRDYTWTVFENIPEERFRFVATSGGDGHIYIFGGQKYHNTTCDCFPVSDHVLSMEVVGKTGFSSAPHRASLSCLAIAMGALAYLWV